MCTEEKDRWGEGFQPRGDLLLHQKATWLVGREKPGRLAASGKTFYTLCEEGD